MQPADSLAVGMEHVPRDHYTAYLYKGAQVLPPTQTRGTDRGGLPSIHITVSGNTFGAGLDEAAVAGPSQTQQFGKLWPDSRGEPPSAGLWPAAPPQRGGAFWRKGD